MSVSIAWLLAQKDLELTHRGGPTRGSRAVSFVHATELSDPSPWLSGGELVLTTGLGLDSGAEASGDYVRRLEAAGVACVGFGTGLSHRTIPAALLSAANDVGLPILEVPYPTPFAAVVRTVMNRIAEQDYDEVLRAAKVQARITRAALHGGVDALIRELAVATGTEVVFVGPRSESVYPAAAWELVTMTREVVADGRTPEAASISISEPGRTLTVQPVGLSRATAGHLAMVTSGPVSGVEQVLLGHAVSLLTLEVEKPARLRAEQTRLHATATGLLLDGRFDDGHIPDYLRDAADPRGRVRVLAIAADPEAGVVDHVDQALASVGRQLFERSDGVDATVVLLYGEDDTEFVEGLLPDHPSVRAGVSTDQAMSDSGTALEQARLALKLAAPGREGRLVDFRTAHGSLLLASEPARAALVTLAGSTVTTLADHDEAHAGDLLPSLRAFLEANGGWEAAATQLGVHRHTLRGRIGRIEQVLGIDLGHARVRAELLLSILAVDATR
ncbi:PucR family transcriptional regulator [Rhodococcoides kyotonense]|uniref:PucR family transcriptional regulator n=1 Tax=Rhodococcoides kyotonense TaxID=398843 RepID=UPI000B790697|nr:PucR family transcriptional regulator [Rhodococcus kyotonensis]